MPFCAGTETKTIPDTQNGPGKGCREHNNQVCYSGFSPDPPKKDENYQRGMKDEKEFVQKSIHVILRDSFYSQDLSAIYNRL